MKADPWFHVVMSDSMRLVSDDDMEHICHVRPELLPAGWLPPPEFFAPHHQCPAEGEASFDHFFLEGQRQMCSRPVQTQCQRAASPIVNIVLVTSGV